MADKRPSGGGGGYLRKSSSGILKRSSSVEILTGLLHSKTQPSITPKKNDEQSTSRDNVPTEENLATAKQPVIETGKTSPRLPTSSSTPSFDTGLSTPKSNGSLSSIRSHGSGALDIPPYTLGPTLTSTPIRGHPPSEASEMLPSPLTSQKKIAVVKPVVGEGGHLFKVTTTEPPADIRPADANPLALRRKRKDPVTLNLTEDSSDAGSSTQSEPVWQKRLSQLFVPPSERELKKNADEKEPPKTTDPEETSKLLPKSTPKPKRKKEPEEEKKKKEENVAYLNEVNKTTSAGDSRGNNNNNNRRKRSEVDKEEEEEKEEGEEEEEEEEEESIVKFNNRINFHDDVLREKKSYKDRKRRESQGNQEEEDGNRLSVLDQIESKGHDSDDDIGSRLSSADDDEEDPDDDAYGFKDGYTSWDDTICSNRSAYFKLYYSQRGVIGPNRSEDAKSKASRASSLNSLSSLIREKMGRPQLPASKKTRADIGLIILVAVLFIIIVVGISLTSYFYNLHLLEMTIFSSIKFFEKSRVLEIFNSQWESVATAHLGSHLPHEAIPEDCTHYLHYLHKHNHTMPNDDHDHDSYEDFVCLDWHSLARLQLRKRHPVGDVQCYSVWWVASREDFTLRDCLQVGGEHGAWWGGGEMSDGGYPVTNADVPPTQMVTGKLGKGAWGQLLRRTWLSEHASLLTLPDSFQGYVSINHGDDGQVCIEARPHPHLKSPTPTLEYTLCTAPNITNLSHFMHQKAINNRRIVVSFSKDYVSPNFDEEPNTDMSNSSDEEMQHEIPHIITEEFGEEVVNRVKERIDQPVWVPWMPPNKPELTQDAVLKYVESIVDQDYGNWGHVLLPPAWQGRPGELTFDEKRFPDPTALVDGLEKKGFRLALSIHPFVSVNAPAFNNGTQAGIWVRQSKSPLPALARYNDEHPSVVTDFSNPKAKEWFSSRLKVLQDTYNIDRFHLQPADAHALPAFHEYHIPLPGPDSVLIHFMASVSSISSPMSSEGAITPPLPPTFLTLGHSEESWQGLETLIPRILTLTMLGFPLIDIGVIGGTSEAGHVPERELYIRWMEISAFLPAFQVSVLPRMYGEEMKKLTMEYNKLRKDLVLPRLHEKIPDALKNGTPLITPLALFSSKDKEATKIDDQWILGRDLLVAPVTQRGQRDRDIYLPEGIWEDGIDKHLRRGGRWIRNYKVPLTKVPYFILKSMDEFNV